MTASTVVVKHAYQAAPDQVFAAWLDPARVSDWLFATPDGKTIHAEIDAHVGGTFHITDHREGENVDHLGEYVAIDRPRLLAFDFTVPKYSSVKTRVAVGIVPKDGGTEITLTHSGVLDEYKDRTSEGWKTILDNLARQF